MANTIPVKIKMKRTHPDAVAPKRMREEDAGFDLYCLNEVTLAPGQHRVVETGWCILIPEGYEGQVRPSSGLAAKQGVTVLNAPGTIDHGYTGPCNVD